MKRNKHRRGRSGFSLIEVAVATAIVGIALAALLMAVGAHTRVGDAGSKLTTGAFLADEIREWTIALPFSDPDPGDANNPPGPDGASPQVYVDDLDDLLGVTYSPPRDGQGYIMYELEGWSQTITLSWRDPNDPATIVSPGASDIVNVQVDVQYEGKPVTSCSWLVARNESE